MRLLHVSRQFHPAIGGIETVALNLGLALQARGHSVDIATLNRTWETSAIQPAQETYHGLKIDRLSFFGSHRYAIAPAILNRVKNHDLVHLHSSDFFLDFLSLTRFLHHVPLILHTHGLFFHSAFASDLKRLYLQTVTRSSLSATQAIICDSRKDMRLLERIVRPDKCHLIPNGVHQDFFNFSNQTRDPHLVISVGRLAENKRYHLLLDAFQIVLQNQPFACLMIIGKDQGEWVILKQRAEKLGISEHVQFLGEVSREVMLEMLSKAAVWTTASAYESFGIALLESMAAGCIPVVQRLDAFEDFLDPGKNGYFTDFQDLNRAAGDLLNALSLNADQRSSLVREAQTTAQQYTWDRIAEKVEKIYKTVLTRNA